MQAEWSLLSEFAETGWPGLFFPADSEALSHTTVSVVPRVTPCSVLNKRQHYFTLFFLSMVLCSTRKGLKMEERERGKRERGGGVERERERTRNLFFFFFLTRIVV